jgi:hypothetical protein
VPEPAQLALARVVELRARTLEGKFLQQVFLAALAQRLRELGVEVEVILDRGLFPAR